MGRADTLLACSLTLDKAGARMATKSEMIAITTSNSTKVKPCLLRIYILPTLHSTTPCRNKPFLRAHHENIARCLSASGRARRHKNPLAQTNHVLLGTFLQAPSLYHGPIMLSRTLSGIFCPILLQLFCL